MLIYIREHAKNRYKSQRRRYIQSIVVVSIMAFVMTMAVLVWFFDSQDATFTSKLCASYVFLSVNFVAIVGREGFLRTLLALECVLNLRQASFEGASTLFLVFAFDAIISSVVCGILALFELEIGAFGVVHLMAGYIPMALLSLAVFPNRLYRLAYRRTRMQQFKQHIS